MILGQKTLEKLRNLINEETEYRSGPKLVQFFNSLGFRDSYGQGFPSRWMYTDECLSEINGTPELDRCIRNVLAPVNFIGNYEALDKHIEDLNQYLAFDKWKIIRDGAELRFQKLDKVEINESQKSETIDEFLSKEFTDVDISKLGLEASISQVLRHRISEIEKCYNAKSPLSVVFLAGSTLEGIFLGLASMYPKQFNMANASPKDENGKVKQFHEWSLAAYIDVGNQIGLIEHDTHKFSHSLRDFRNYIHPFEQLSSGFTPREQTAKICLQVLKAAIADMNDNLKKIGT